MQKILVTDLDGTLIFSRKVSQKDKQALQDFRDAKGLVIVATGRSYEGTRPIWEELHLPFDYLILTNGSFILDAERRSLWHRTFSQRVAVEVYQAFVQHEGEHYGYALDTLYQPLVVERNYRFTEMPSYAQLVSEEAFFRMEGEYLGGNIVPLSKDAQDGERVRQAVEARFGDQLEVFRNQYFVDLAPAGCSKGLGVQRLLEMQGFLGQTEQHAEVHAIGDSWNDWSMFQHADVSYVLAHAEDALKQHATFTVGSVAECIALILSKGS